MLQDRGPSYRLPGLPEKVKKTLAPIDVTVDPTALMLVASWRVSARLTRTGAFFPDLVAPPPAALQRLSRRDGWR